MEVGWGGVGWRWGGGGVGWGWGRVGWRWRWGGGGVEVGWGVMWCTYVMCCMSTILSLGLSSSLPALDSKIGESVVYWYIYRALHPQCLSRDHREGRTLHLY